MATKRAIFNARRDRLLQIESKVRSWWEEKGVSSPQTHYMKLLTEISRRPYWPWGFNFNSETRSKSTVSFPSPGEAISVYSTDATLYTIAGHSADSVPTQKVGKILYSVVTCLAKEIEWMEEFMAEDQSSMRTDSLSTSFPDRAFENQINAAVKIKVSAFRNLESPKPCFRFLQDARDWYKFSCGAVAGGMNRNLVLHYMDVQTILINFFCPHYADYVWREVLKKDGPVIDARWPSAAPADSNLFAASKYLHKVIRMINEDKTITEDQKKVSSCLIYVKEQENERRQELLRMVQIKRVNESCTLSDMQAFHMASSPSWERDVIEENLDLMKRLCGIQDVQVLSATALDDLAKAGPLFSQLYERPPSPEHPTIIFLTR